jgi:transposase InsO family protein
MPWARTDWMSERVKFIAACLQAEASFSELCLDFGISRKTGYKWVQRYEAGGVEALVDRSHAPQAHPHAVPGAVIEAVLAIRRRHPRWGPLKLRVVLGRQQPGLVLPAASTIGDILKRHGLAPNAVWCADFKGCFPVGGERCHPLTISDGYSRFLLCCQALRRPLSGQARKVFESAFREYGLPETIRTDNGSPFSTLAPAGLSRLAVWWIRLGIRPERIMPGRPDQNGRHERMHSTLKAETAKPPRSSFRAQQLAFDRFRAEYNGERPHEALGQQTPATLYRPSTRLYPRVLPEIIYPAHFETRVTYPNGVISFEASQWYVSDCLAGERVGLEEGENHCWRVYFSSMPIGMIDLARGVDRGNRRFGLLVPIIDLPSGRRRRRLYRI